MNSKILFLLFALLFLLLCPVEIHSNCSILDAHHPNCCDPSNCTTLARITAETILTSASPTNIQAYQKLSKSPHAKLLAIYYPVIFTW